MNHIICPAWASCTASQDCQRFPPRRCMPVLCCPLHRARAVRLFVCTHAFKATRSHPWHLPVFYARCAGAIKDALAEALGRPRVRARIKGLWHVVDGTPSFLASSLSSATIAGKACRVLPFVFQERAAAQCP